MPVEKFFIGPPDEGQITRYKPWALPETAFAQLRNSYVWRGSCKKRFGAQPMNPSKTLVEQPLFTRLRINIGTVTTHAIPGGASALAIGQMFSVGSDMFTIYQTGAGVLTLTTNAAATATIDTTVNPNTVVFTGLTGGDTVYWYPSNPVMHFGIYKIVTVNIEDTFAFDTQFAYTFTLAGGWVRSDAEATAAGESLWTGTDADFFWSTNYRGVASDDFLMFVTNNVIADAMRYWDGATWNFFGTAATTPINAVPDFIKTCAIIESFDDRLLLFDVTETTAGPVNTRYRNRIRYSKAVDPLAANSWLQQPGLGGFIDIPVKESIMSVQFIKNRCIVFMESSTWELVITNSPLQPFLAQQLDSELGVESMNSTIPFDKAILGFGNVGIHACNGQNVERIDEKIPTTIFNVNNENSGTERVAGIRDYFNELAYWSYTSTSVDTGFDNKYPNRVLVYNYTEDTWGYNDDSITAFGYFQKISDLTWNDVEATWDELDTPWDSPTSSARFQSVIAGNQEGWTFLVNAEDNTNSMSLQITNLTVAANVVTITTVNHNLANNSYVFIQGVQDDDIIAAAVNNLVFKVNNTTSSSVFTIILDSEPTGTYTGGGIVTLVTPPEILTKEYNFFLDKAANMAVNQIDFYVDNSSDNQVDDDGVLINGGGQMTVTYFLSSSTYDIAANAIQDGGMLGTSILETVPYDLIPMERYQARFWHTLYPNFLGETIQLKFYLTDAQIRTGFTDATNPIPYPAFQSFQLNAMIFYAQAVNPIGG